MQYTLIDLLDIDHILLGVEAVNAQDAIRIMTAALVQTGHVKPEFADDVWEREKTFPTGLPTQPLPVAIPHADPTFIQQSAVGIGVLKSSVLFGQMGTDGSTELEIKVLFLLAIKEREKQVEMIQQLMTLLQTPSLLEGLSVEKQPAAVLDLINKTLT
jgi:PTS system galactitol-specific IIA component